MAIEGQGLEIQIGARTLLNPTDFHVAKGDKIGLVGRNGAGKTTLTKVITGDMLPTSGKVHVSGKLGYLPQDTHAADPQQTALDRLMSARDIAKIITRLRKSEKDMTDSDPDIMMKAMDRYDKATQDFEKAGGYAAQSEAIAMADSLGLPQETMEQRLGTLSGGQRRRIEMARILFSDADTLILDEPTNHLDIQSKEIIKLALQKFEGTLIVISHDREFLQGLADKIFEFRDGEMKEFLGSVDEYLEFRQKESIREISMEKAKLQNKSLNESEEYKEEKQVKAVEKEEVKVISKEQKQLEGKLKKAEERIAELEEEIAQKEKGFSNKNPEPKELEAYEKLKKDLEEQMELWEALALQIE